MDYRSALLLSFFLFALTLAGIVLVTRHLQPRADRTGDQTDTAWIQVDVRYAVPALIFVAFDMEMLYMFPWAVAYLEVGPTAFFDMFVFAAILGVGLAYAWKRGAFEL